jgi:hypothetical protein
MFLVQNNKIIWVEYEKNCKKGRLREESSSKSIKSVGSKK